MIQTPYLNQSSPTKLSPETLTSCHFLLFEFNKLSFPHLLVDEGVNWEMQRVGRPREEKKSCQKLSLPEYPRVEAYGHK